MYPDWKDSPQIAKNLRQVWGAYFIDERKLWAARTILEGKGWNNCKAQESSRVSIKAGIRGMCPPRHLRMVFIEQIRLGAGRLFYKMSTV